MTTSQKNNPESGQVLILMVTAMVVLFGFLALAIDGGMVYSDRRVAQNAADASALAGAGKIALYLGDKEYDSCSNSTINSARSTGVNTAQTLASTNGFTIDSNLDDKNGVTTSCSNTNGYINYIDVQVMITTETQTAFAHLIYNGLLKNTVEAIARVRPGKPLALGNAIVALNPQPDCSGPKHGVDFHGNASIIVNGGGVLSEGCMEADGTVLSVDVQNGSNDYVGELDNPFDVFTPAPTHVNDPLALENYWIDPPDCDQVDYYGSPSTAYRNNASGLIEPGNYSKIKSNGEVYLRGGGLYCLYGDFDMGGDNLYIQDYDKGVTIYLKSGSFVTNGNGEVIIKAPSEDPDPYPALAGILIYLDKENDGEVKLRGTSSSSYYGTVFAPGGTIDAAGTADHVPSLHTQLIGWDVLVGGTADIKIIYQKGENAWLPPDLEMAR